MVRYLLIVLVAGIVGAILARPKGRSPVLWFILCAIVPFLVIAIVLLPPLVAKGFNKKCAYCGEVIKEEASVCKYCGGGNQY